MNNRRFVTRCMLLLVLLMVAASVFGCASLTGKRDTEGPELLDHTVQLYLRALQEKKWREVVQYWREEERSQFRQWRREIPETVVFAQLEISDAEKIEVKEPGSAPKKEEKDKGPIQYRVFITVERYAENVISITKEEWEMVWEYDREAKRWEAISQIVRKLR